MTKRQARTKPPKKLLIDVLSPTLEERCAAILRRPLPPSADEFDRVCYEAIEDFMRLNTRGGAPNGRRRPG